MIRNDFVSNSSSCSFFVSIETQQDLNELAAIWNRVKELTRNYVPVYSKGIEYALTHCYGGERITTGYLDKDDWKLIEVGDAIKIDSGEDDEPYALEKLDDLYDLFSSGYKFKVFCDEEAHYTKGEYFDVVYGREPKQES